MTLFGQKAPKGTGMMTSLGFPGLSSQSVSGFLGPFWPENPETDWNDKPGLPRFVIPIRFGFFGPFRPENLKRTCVTSPRFPDCPGTNLSQHDYIAGGGGVPVRLAGLILRFLHRPIPAPITGKHVRVEPVFKRLYMEHINSGQGKDLCTHMSFVYAISRELSVPELKR